MNGIGLLRARVVGNFSGCRYLINLAADPPGNLTRRTHMQDVLRGEVSDVFAVRDVARLSKGYVVRAKKAFSRRMILIQDDGFELSSVAVEAAKLDEISRDDACRCIEQNLPNEVAAKVVYDFRMQCLDVANE